jgi:hypothetical protein
LSGKRTRRFVVLGKAGRFLAIPDRCTCQACKHTWLPQHYLLLSKVLGLDTPDGVVG